MKAKGNMYEFATTWNPLAGECPHGCIYCSTHKLRRFPVIDKKYSGDLRIDENSLSKQPHKFNDIIFVCAQTDLFADNVPKEHVLKILSNCNNLSLNYFFQTKNPERINEFKEFIPIGSILCCTIESDYIPNHIEIYKGYVPSILSRIEALKKIDWITKQITIEPIMQIFSVPYFASILESTNPIQINIGANTYKKAKLIEPTKQSVLDLIEKLEKFTVVKQKSNLQRLLK